MDLNKQLENMKEKTAILPREERIRQTVLACQDACFRQEQHQLLTYWEFLWSQLRYTRKRWWALQAGLLLFAWALLPTLEDSRYRLRTVGVIGCLFVVLIIPELWRNRETNSIQVEAACLYSLRQVYAARVTLFGLVDVVLLSLFSLTLGRMGFTLVEVLSQFLLPVTVTACICFSLLCGKSNFGETVSLAACLIFGGTWWLVLMNEAFYESILPAVWVALFAAALGFLGYAIRTAVREANQYWEVSFI